MIKKELSLRMGENVRQCRKDKGYTQEDLAEACNFSAAFCAQVETGSRMMSLPTLVKVSEVLHTTPNILIYGKTKNERIAHIVSMLGLADNDVRDKIIAVPCVSDIHAVCTPFIGSLCGKLLTGTNTPFAMSSARMAAFLASISAFFRFLILSSYRFCAPLAFRFK